MCVGSHSLPLYSLPCVHCYTLFPSLPFTCSVGQASFWRMVSHLICLFICKPSTYTTPYLPLPASFCIQFIPATLIMPTLPCVWVLPFLCLPLTVPVVGLLLVVVSPHRLPFPTPFSVVPYLPIVPLPSSAVSPSLFWTLPFPSPLPTTPCLPVPACLPFLLHLALIIASPSTYLGLDGGCLVLP